MCIYIYIYIYIYVYIVYAPFTSCHITNASLYVPALSKLGEKGTCTAHAPKHG